MILKWIRLHNIRSYKDQLIKFPTGTVLLSGDVGAGKTSILLALEFALFGLQPGLISGQELLRQGAHEGSVEVELEVKGKSIKIRRNLQRKKKGVMQGKGSLTLDGRESFYGPEELKAKILELLNYPHELLKKANLLYRFTLYTPQEQMRQIMLERAEERLDTIRRIFGLDRYRAVIANSELVASKLRVEARVLEAELADLPQKQAQLEAQKAQLTQLKARLEQLRAIHEQALLKLKAAQAQLEQLRAKLKELAMLKAAYATKEAELKALKESISYLTKKAEESTTKAQLLEKELKPVKLKEEQLRKELKEKEATEKAIRAQLLEYETKAAQLETEKNNASKVKAQVLSLRRCPTCKQFVSEGHKQEIAKEADEKIAEVESKLKVLNQKRNEAKQLLEQLLEEQAKLRQQEKLAALQATQLERLKEWKRLALEYSNEAKSAELKVKEIVEELSKLSTKLRNLEQLEAEYEKQEAEVSQLQNDERKKAIEYAANAKEVEALNEQITALEQEVKLKQQKKAELQKYREVSEWLLQRFTPLVLRIEQAVMAALNKQFNMLFEKWFSMLVEGLQVKVDENFSPIIEQQGYELSYDTLSGGERTAVALAYRLALNQLINCALSRLETKGLLILDEPTDGFSSEQLDKLRDVFQELKIDQLILVSHETKVEAFVEHVIRLKKTNYVSTVAA